MATCTVIFLTHEWDDDIAAVAARASGCCGSAAFVVATNEGTNSIVPSTYSKLLLERDFASYHLPMIPKDQFLWWNADFILYSARRNLAPTEYYALLENDVLLNCDLDTIIDACARRNIDLAAHQINHLPETHWMRPSVRDLSAEPWSALSAFIILSCRAIDRLLKVRQQTAVALQDGRIKQWPHCETFIPTVIAQHNDLHPASLSSLLNTDLLRNWPVLSINDPHLCETGIVAHPVKSGARFWKAFLAEPLRPPAGRAELIRYRSGFYRASSADTTLAQSTQRYKLRHFRMNAPPDGGGTGNLAVILQDEASIELLTKAVLAIVQEKIFGVAEPGLCNVDSIATLWASIDSSQYASAHMVETNRFADADDLRDYAASCAASSGLILEFGVFSGYTINRFADQLPQRQIFGFDSFEGLPEGWMPGIEKGTFKREAAPNIRDNVELVVGWFDETLPLFLISHPDDVALLHIDCDLYSSTKTVLSLLADRIVPGTLIVFDEYFNYPSWRQHEHRAFSEFVQSRQIKYEYIGLVPNHVQVLVKILEVGVSAEGRSDVSDSLCSRRVALTRVTDEAISVQHSELIHRQLPLTR